jgi:pimeloyl-ACP methyl ester carboxylesterase
MAPNAEVARLLMAYEPAEALSLFDTGPTAKWLADHAPDNLASLRSFFGRNPIAVTRALLASIADDGPGISRDEIARIACPALVIGNGMDFIHPIEMARDVSGLIPGSRFVEIAPKAASIERYRAEFRAALHDFLAAIP